MQILDWVMILAYFALLAGVVVASATIGVWYWCTDQFIIQRTLAAKNLTNARRGAIWGGFLKLAPVFLFLVPGMLGFALHHNHVVINGAAFAIPLKESGALNGDTVFPTLVQTLLPTGFRGLVVEDINFPKSAGQLYPSENPFV